MTIRVAIGVAAFCLVMNVVFAVLGYWDYTVLTCSVLGGVYAVGNFLLMGLTVQKMAADPDIKHAKQMFQLSYSVRQLVMVGIVILAFVAPVFNGLALVISLLFPKFTILLLQASGKFKADAQGEDEKLDG